MFPVGVHRTCYLIHRGHLMKTNTSRQQMISKVSRLIPSMEKKKIVVLPTPDLFFVCSILDKLSWMGSYVEVTKENRGEFSPFKVINEKTCIFLSSTEDFTAFNLSLAIGESLAYQYSNRSSDNLPHLITYLQKYLEDDYIFENLYDEMIFSALIFLYSIDGIDDLACMVASCSERAFLGAAYLYGSNYTFKKLDSFDSLDVFVGFLKTEISLFQINTDAILLGSTRLLRDLSCEDKDGFIFGCC